MLRAASGVATFILVKPVFLAQDPNWGRILAALGSSGIPLEKERVNLSIGDILVFSQDSPVNINLSKLKEALQKDKIEVCIGLGGGDKSYCVYTADLSYDYVKINADYST